MAQHGYLREYDEGWDRGDDRDRDDWRERSERDWREADRNLDWQDRDRRLNFMFGDRDRARLPDRDRDRGFISRMGDEARSWFRDEGDRGVSGRRQQAAFGGSNEWREERSSYSSHPDDHYRSWRDRQMQSLDRDYEDYCREREQRFHEDFDSWRQNRQQQGGLSKPVMELEKPVAESVETQDAGTSAMDAAKLGTNNSENSTTGRGRR